MFNVVRHVAVLGFLALLPLAPLGLGRGGLYGLAILGGALLLALLFNRFALGLSLSLQLATLVRLYLNLPRVAWRFDLGAARRASGVPGTVLQEGPWRIYHDLPPQQSDWILEVVQATRRELEPRLQIQDQGGRIFVFQSRDACQRCLRAWVGRSLEGAVGCAHRAGYLRIFLETEASRRFGRDPRVVLAHELVHALSQQASPRLPRHVWLNEGFATAWSISRYDPASEASTRRILTRAQGMDLLVPWDKLPGMRVGQLLAMLSGKGPSRILRVHLIYTQSAALVSTLLEEGEPGWAALVALLRSPDRVHALLRRHLEQDLPAVVQRTVARLATPVPMPPGEDGRREDIARALEAGVPDPYVAAAILALSATDRPGPVAVLQRIAARDLPSIPEKRRPEMADLARTVLDLVAVPAPP